MYEQRAVYFPLVDHLVQELNDRLLLQENRFLGQYLVPAKLNASNSGVHDNNNNNNNNNKNSLYSIKR